MKKVFLFAFLTLFFGCVVIDSESQKCAKACKDAGAAMREYQANGCGGNCICATSSPAGSHS